MKTIILQKRSESNPKIRAVPQPGFHSINRTRTSGSRIAILTVILSWLWLVTVGLPFLALAQTNTAPDSSVDAPALALRAGEILLIGRIDAVDPAQNTLTLGVTSFTLPTGKANELATAKPKVVVLDARTHLHVRGARQLSVTLADLTALEDGIFAAVVGPDKGSGQSLAAREVAVWDRIEAGHFRFKDKVAPAIQAENSRPIANTARPNDAAINDAAEDLCEPPVNNIFPYGEFEDIDERGIPVGWTFADKERIKVVAEADNHFLRLTNPAGPDGKPNNFVAVALTYKLNATYKKIRLYARMRARQLRMGPNAWDSARLNPQFEDGRGNRVGPFQPVIQLRQDSDWVKQQVDTEVPPGATHIRISAETFASGVIDYDDIQIEPNPPPATLPSRRWRSLFPEGKFETLDAQGKLLGWKATSPANIKVMEENGNHFLRLTNLRNGPVPWQAYLGAPCRFKLDPNWKKIRLSVRMRASQLKTGTKPWEDARLALSFEDGGGNHVGPWTAVPTLKKDTDWMHQELELDVTPGAVYIALSPEMQGCSGVVDYDDIHLEPLN